MNLDARQLRPGWDHTTTVRGIVIAMRPPDQVDADNDLRAWKFRGLVHLPGAAWSLLRRIVVGEAPLNAYRKAIAKTWPPAHRELAMRLTGAEVLEQVAIYQGAQMFWSQSLQEATMERLASQRAAEPPAPPVSAQPSSAAPQEQRIVERYPMSSGHLPDAMRGLIRHAQVKKGDA